MSNGGQRTSPHLATGWRETNAIIDDVEKRAACRARGERDNDVLE